MNGFFKWDDVQAYAVGGYPINQNWWSRRYEYPWAFEYAEPGQVVADMGCGWTPRPFKDALTTVCERVYAVDGNEKILGLEKRARLEYVVADFSKRIEAIETGSLDRVFCISVLEDVGDWIPGALREFERVLKPDGRIVVTFDVQYEMERPLGQYPGVIFDKFLKSVKVAGLMFEGEVEMDKRNAVYHQEFNLCVFHGILKKF